MNRPLVVLFDIDGTLIRTDGAGRRGFTRAFADVFGAPDAFAGIAFSGRTDRSLLAEAALAALGRLPTPAEADAFFTRYAHHLPESLEAMGYEVLPGVFETLDRLQAHPRCALGLATGNTAEGARLKLLRGGLAQRFTFGGYGSDDPEREVLTRRALERGLRALDLPRHEVEVLVIGDSEHDLRCAHAIHAHAVGVLTGWTPREALLPERPHVLLDDLTGLIPWMEAAGLLDPATR